jgi:hypothetical protein
MWALGHRRYGHKPSWDADSILTTQCMHVQIINIDAAIGGLPGEPCALSGLAFTPDGKRIYVGVEGSEMDMGPHGILAFDAHMLSRITFGAAELA